MLLQMKERLGLPLTVVLVVAVAVIGSTLAARHWDHLIAAAPLLVLAGCALMHLFMHRHGGHGDGHGGGHGR